MSHFLKMERRAYPKVFYLKSKTKIIKNEKKT